MESMRKSRRYATQNYEDPGIFCYWSLYEKCAKNKKKPEKMWSKCRYLGTPRMSVRHAQTQIKNPERNPP